MQASILTSSPEPAGNARLLRSANRAPGTLMWLACAAMALPAAWTSYLACTGKLGTNPLEALIREPGRWALNYLMGALAVSPARHLAVILSKRVGWGYGKRLSDWNWLIRLRRPIGLAAFFYALAHLAVYLVFDLNWNLDDLADDLREKPYIMAGVACFVILLPLAITSTDGWMKRLKGRWKQLHYSVYAAGLLAVLHYQFLSKPGVSAPSYYEGLLGLMLGARIILHLMRKSPAQERIDGAVPERERTHASARPNSSGATAQTNADAKPAPSASPDAPN
jgi:sulfoxide reductase heme-binding subunit YedZ